MSLMASLLRGVAGLIPKECICIIWQGRKKKVFIKISKCSFCIFFMNSLCTSFIGHLIVVKSCPLFIIIVAGPSHRILS